MNRIPAEAFPPSEFIREEMAAREWSVADLAYHTVIPVQEIQALLDNKPLTLYYAERLAAAFGTSPMLWANLWVAWKKYGRVHD